MIAKQIKTLSNENRQRLSLGMDCILLFYPISTYYRGIKLTFPVSGWQIPEERHLSQCEW